MVDDDGVRMSVDAVCRHAVAVDDAAHRMSTARGARRTTGLTLSAREAV
ncbi:hypothetical protein [Micromonospora rosaria]|nr:hypothetical protein [Micromonospora rosaria]